MKMTDKKEKKPYVRRERVKYTSPWLTIIEECLEVRPNLFADELCEGTLEPIVFPSVGYHKSFEYSKNNLKAKFAEYREFVDELDNKVLKMSRNMFELYAKTKLDIANEAKRDNIFGAEVDIHIMDVLKSLDKELDHDMLTATISQLIASDQMKRPDR